MGKKTIGIAEIAAVGVPALLTAIVFSCMGGGIDRPSYFVLGGIAAACYMIPFIIAGVRQAKARWGIYVLCLLSAPLDAVVIGIVVWIFCLIWAIVAKSENDEKSIQQVVSVYSTPPPTLPTPPPIHVNTGGNGQTSTHDGRSLADELSKLAELYKAGSISESEYQALKNKIIG